MENRKHWLFEIKVALLAVAVSVLYFGLTFTIKAKGRLKNVSYNSISPSLMPRIIAVLAIVVSIVMLVEAVTNYRKAGDAPAGAKAQGLLSFLDRDKVILLVLVVAYLLLMNVVGYVISTALFSLVVLTYLDRKHLVRNLIYSVAFPVACYLIFNQVLSIWLPAGMLFE